MAKQRNLVTCTTALALALALGGCGVGDDIRAAAALGFIEAVGGGGHKPVAVHGATLSVVDLGRSRGAASEADVHTRILDAADALAANRPDLVSVLGAPTSGDVARLLDELWRRGVAYDEVVRQVDSAALVARSDAGYESLATATGDYVVGDGGWIYVDLVRGGEELRVIATRLETVDERERLLQVEELVGGPGLIDVPVVLAAELGPDGADPQSETQRVLAEDGYTDADLETSNDDATCRVLVR
jgi:hypothetical protein